MPESNKKLMRELDAGLARAQEWIRTHPGVPFSVYLRGAEYDSHR